MTMKHTKGSQRLSLWVLAIATMFIGSLALAGAASANQFNGNASVVLAKGAGAGGGHGGGMGGSAGASAGVGHSGSMGESAGMGHSSSSSTFEHSRGMNSQSNMGLGRDLDKSKGSSTSGFSSDQNANKSSEGFQSDRDRNNYNSENSDKSFSTEDQGWNHSNSDRDRNFNSDRDRGFSFDRDRNFNADRDKGFKSDFDRSGYTGEHDSGYHEGFGADHDRGTFKTDKNFQDRDRFNTGSMSREHTPDTSYGKDSHE